MSVAIKVYKSQDFLRLTEAGELDHDRSMEFVRKLAQDSVFHPDHNILMDLRDTTIPVENMANLFDIVNEMAGYRHSFRNRIANIIPDNPERIKIAQQFKDTLVNAGFQYNFFTSYEAAMEWLSETTS